MTTNFRGFWNSHQPHSNSATLSAEDKSACYFADTVGIEQKHLLSKRVSFARLTLGVMSGWVVSQIALPVHAATLLNNSGVQFDQDVTLESNFIESHGAYQSTFGVINLNTKEKTPLLVETKASDNAETIFKPSSRRNHLGADTDFRGTPGKAVPKPVAQYNFKANQPYVLYLESSYNGRPTGILYSTDVLNPSREQQVQFAGGANDLCTSGIMVGWDDTGSKIVRNREQQDRDFDDFVVKMKSMSCGMGGGELPSVQAAAPSSPSVGALPPAAPGRTSALWALPLAAIPLLFINGGNRGGGGGLVDDSRIVAPIKPNPPVKPNPPISSNPPISPNPPSCPSGNCKPVPEPLTILGSGSAIAMATLLERRRKRKR